MRVKGLFIGILMIVVYSCSKEEIINSEPTSTNGIEITKVMKV